MTALEQVPRMVRASSREPLMEVFCTHAKCVALKPVGEMKKGT